MTLILILFLILRREQKKDMLILERKTQEYEKRRDERLRFLNGNFESNDEYLERKRRMQHLEMSLFPTVRHDTNYLSTRGEEQ